MGRPAGVVDVRLVEIGCEGSHGVEEVGYCYDGAAWGEEWVGHGLGLIDGEVEEV